MVAFHIFCRAGELLRITRGDVVVPQDSRLSFANQDMGVFLRDTKTGKNQYVSITDPQIAQLLLMLSLSTAHRDRLFPFSNSKWLRWIKKACRSLDIAHHFVVHSLRHGGATNEFISGTPLQRIQMRGRWKCFESMLTYLQQGRAVLIARSLPHSVPQCGRIFCRDLVGAFALAARGADSSFH